MLKWPATVTGEVWQFSYTSILTLSCNRLTLAMSSESTLYIPGFYMECLAVLDSKYVFKREKKKKKKVGNFFIRDTYREPAPGTDFMRLLERVSPFDPKLSPLFSILKSQGSDFFPPDLGWEIFHLSASSETVKADNLWMYLYKICVDNQYLDLQTPECFQQIV